MKSAVKKSVLRLLLPVLLLAAPACRRDARNQNPDTPSPPAASAPPAASVAPVPAPTTTTDHAEVFRRAFWRHPAPADQILQAERRVNPDDGSWRWFIQLHPGPELLAALRAPDTFGLLRLPPGTAPRPWVEPTDSPSWFPPHASIVSAAASTGLEILQAPAASFTVIHRANDNMLFATDTGSGFAPPAR